MSDDRQRIDWLADAAHELASQDLAPEYRAISIRAVYGGFEVSLGRVAVEASTLRQALDVAIEATTEHPLKRSS